jgi:hypothetical protein
VKKIFSIFAIMLAVSLFLEAQERVYDPTIVFKVIEHNYGEIEYGSDGTCTFTFTNKGETPLVISNVRATCGCTVPNWTRDPIKPGEEGEIKVKYNTNIVGTFNKSITVTSNGNPANIVLRIKGKVNPKPVEQVY